MSGSWADWTHPQVPLTLGASACLLGEAVRYDRGSCRDRFLTGTLARWARFERACPEVEAGLGVPRPVLRLVGDATAPRVVETAGGIDRTDELLQASRARADAFAGGELDGVVLKKDSPSCGLARVKIYDANGSPRRSARGVFARALAERAPDLPLEEEGRLNDPRLRLHFVDRVFTRNRWRVFLHRGPSRRRLVEFHTAHKMLVRAHDERRYAELGRLVGTAGDDVYRRYGRLLHEALARPTSVGRHANVLQHFYGYFRDALEPRDRAELREVVEDYRHGVVPLAVPLTVMRLQATKYEVDYLLGQLYLDPHPKELALHSQGAGAK